MNKKVVIASGSILLLLLVFSTTIRAQTIYKTDPGFYSSIVESFYLRGGSIEGTQLIGPAFGYRFNEDYDITFHTEFLSSEIKLNNRSHPKTTLINLGIIFGRTSNLSKRWLL